MFPLRNEFFGQKNDRSASFSNGGVLFSLPLLPLFLYGRAGTGCADHKIPLKCGIELSV